MLRIPLHDFLEQPDQISENVFDGQLTSLVTEFGDIVLLTESQYDCFLEILARKTS